MKITFLGGADEVGASCILLDIGGRRLLVDAGLRPSPKARWGLAGDQLPDLSLIEQVRASASPAGAGLDAILVTHAHTDHTGALELVAGRYPGVPVYATPVTIALTRVLHQDSRRIMQTRLEEEGELPLFDDVAVNKLMAAFSPVPFFTRLPLADGLAATFFPAGHIAGAAMIGLESDEGRVLITGDVSISPQRTVEGAKPPPFQPDVLIIESTYGGRLHANRAVEERRLVETVGEVTAAGGKVLIPAFALGRAQELLLILGEFRRRGELSPVPVWADGMVRAICHAYASFPDALPLPLQEREARFFDEYIRPVERSDQRNALVWQTDPAVIISSSGMLAGGPSLSYARALAGQPQHAILLTGYQDEEAPGRRLQEVAQRGYGTIRLGKDKVDVQCRLGTYSLSAHADEGQLLSLVETLDPHEVLLVHGDEDARSSLAAALMERKRSVTQPRAGQSFEYRFRRPEVRPSAAASGLGSGKRLDLESLWSGLAGQRGGFFTRVDLARLWWGEAKEDQVAELADALEKDNPYFVKRARLPGQPDLYQARTPSQVDLAVQRRQAMAALGNLSGRWLVLRGPQGIPFLARCAGVAPEHLLLEAAGEQLADEPQAAWPEDILEVLGDQPPGPDIFQKYASVSPSLAPAVMEPNQALAKANSIFPPEARLRKAGYRLDQHVLVLNFDFPDSSAGRFAETIRSLQDSTGWQVEIAAEANQNALGALARETLPEGWRMQKGPAIHRDLKRVSLTAVPPSGSAADWDTDPELQAARRRFLETTGYELSVALPAAPVSPLSSPRPVPPPGQEGISGSPWEINTAYAAIKAALDGSTLYRTSLKGDVILLSFISPQVGERYQAEIASLSRQVGWKLQVNPQPNQGAILEAARTLIARQGLAIQKGPGIHPERAEVVVTLPAPPQEDVRLVLENAFLAETGYRLTLSWPAQSASPAGPKPALPPLDVVEIPLERIRLRPAHRSLALSPEKLQKTIDRARRVGEVSPPINVRRLPDGYLLLDGLYRLRAAAALGLERIPAVVE